MAIDVKALRDVLGTFVTGVTVMTTVDAQGRTHGCTANSFSSVSLEPPLVLWSQALKARSYAPFAECQRFVVNILSEDQRWVSQRFASAIDNKFDGVPWAAGIEGLPVLQGASAYLECRKVANYPGGDHTIFIGEVENLHRSAHRPLAFGGGRYMLAFPHELGSADGPDHGSQTEALRLGNAALPEIGARIKVSVGLSVWGNRGPTTVRYEHPVAHVWSELKAGRVLSLLRSATGLLFLAYMPRASASAMVEEELLAETSDETSAQATQEVERRIAEVRQRGMARLFIHRKVLGTDVEFAGFAAPVFDRAGAMVLSLTAIAPASTIDAAWSGPVAAALASEAQNLSRRLGHAVPTAS